MADIRVLDLSGLEPPEPLEKALLAFETLKHGECLHVKFDRDPILLYPLLRVQAYDYASRCTAGGVVELYIWRAGDLEAERAAHAALAQS